jgi:alpha-beta hydrolase superfamily lysophospholipase
MTLVGTLRTVGLAVLLALAACAPRLQEIGAYDTQAELTDTAAIMADGSRLPVRVWAAERPRAVIVGVHGMNDYSNAFAMPAPWFAERRITTYAYDQRSFGETEHRGVWPGSDVMADDLRTMVALVRERHPGLPLYVLGLSMGGAVAMKAQAEGLAVDGIILGAPAIWGWQAMNPVYKSALWLAAHTIPSRTATGSGLEIWPSDNIEMLRAFGRDPLVLDGSRLDAVYGLVTLMDEAYTAAEALTAPVLYLYGAHDQIVPAAPTFAVMQRIGAPKRLVLYREGYHMLLRDLQRERVWTDIAAWIDDKDAPLPSGEEFDGTPPDAAPVSGAGTGPAAPPSGDPLATPASR